MEAHIWAQINRVFFGREPGDKEDRSQLRKTTVIAIVMVFRVNQSQCSLG